MKVIESIFMIIAVVIGFVALGLTNFVIYEVYLSFQSAIVDALASIF